MVGRPEDSNMVPAVVCKRNVAHRRMRTQLQWPKVGPSKLRRCNHFRFINKKEGDGCGCWAMSALWLRAHP